MKKHPGLKMIAIFAVILCFGISPAWGADLYVDVKGAENGNGLDWSIAYTDLQDALATAADGDTIHVAQGTYFPGNTRDVYFIIKRSLTLLGGYPTGGGGRDPAANQTVLSGDIGTINDSSDNAYHVVSIWDPTSGTTMAVTLDGFTIMCGYATEEPHNVGGGMIVTGGFHVTLRNVTFFENWADGGGGGLQFSGSSLTLNNVSFDQNRTQGGGGGLRFTGGNLIMNHVDFEHNRAGAAGGGVNFSGVSAMDMNNVNFTDNISFGASEPSVGAGGGIYNSSVYDSPLNMTNVTLSGNMANGNDMGRGGGIYMARGPESAPIALTNVTLSNNQANGKIAEGGGICFGYTGSNWRYLRLTNVTLSGNQVNGIDWGQGGGISLFPSGDLVMTNVTVTGNIAAGEQSALGGGVFYLPYISSLPGIARTYFRNSIFWGNAPDQLPNGVDASWCVVEGGYDSGHGNIAEDPMLGTLGNYGGFTQTIPLLEGSSAIDAADDYWSEDTDQRGELRPQGAGSDMGAYEASVNLAGILIDPSDPVPVNTEISAEAGFTGVLSGTNAYSAIWDWGDGESSNGTIDGENGIVSGSHVYTEPGVYKVSLEVSEVNESSGLSGLLKTAVYQYVVVYDPEAGFVTGGGWFDSPAGAYKDNIESFGQATFGFVSRYKKGADVPTGNTAFEFAAGGLYFHSTSYEWLVVTGSDYAKFKGSGTINGLGDFKFMVWAGDGAPDTFRIRIWDEVEDTGEEIDIYDNESDQAIDGGSIVIHVK